MTQFKTTADIYQSLFCTNSNNFYMAIRKQKRDALLVLVLKDSKLKNFEQIEKYA